MDRSSRRRLTDVFARRSITAGGLFIVASILAMLAFLVFETLPLWQSAKFEQDSLDFAPGSGKPVALLDMNEHREVVFAITEDGVASTLVRETDERTNSSLLEELSGDSDSGAAPAPQNSDESGTDNLTGTDEGSRAERIDGSSPALEVPADSQPATGAETLAHAVPVFGERGSWVALTNRSRVVPITLEPGLKFVEGKRTYTPSIVAASPGTVELTGTAIALTSSGDEESIALGILTSTGEIKLWRREIEESLFGDEEITDSADSVPVPAGTRVTSLALNGAADLLYLGTETGQLLEWDVRATPNLIGTYQAQDSPIQTLGFLLGGNTLIVGGENGTVEAWFRARDEEEKLRLVRAHQFDSHENPVVGVAESPRNRSFLTWDADGAAKLHFGTTAKTRKSLELDSTAPNIVRFAPKSNGIFAGTEEGAAASWTLDDPHPEMSLKTLFGKIHYEGFSEPVFAWQSTGSTDETEPKISLVPLVFGSLKGTLYAMLFSAPIAILAALYTSVFMRPRLRAIVKPTMELMATIPSVVLGLLAGLWLAPRLQSGMPVLLTAGLFLPLIVLLAGWAHATLPAEIRRRIKPGTEAMYLMPLIAVATGFLLASNGVVDGLFEGGFLDWLYQRYEIRYDQRNALVVGIAMGLAVIPIIFSVSEDALSAVPRHLTAGSLALGATPWQTAWRVILPAASPGIFSALMIGFGRAVGETMIILMATGNTPIMDWSVFNGFRTLSANIAVEIPEAPHGGSLYRVLFVSAVLLFSFTLIVNTTAEIVSTRLRKRYSRF